MGRDRIGKKGVVGRYDREDGVRAEGMKKEGRGYVRIWTLVGVWDGNFEEKEKTD